jgi:predicted TIM-barrel fold metal-dependent hydrolase
MPVIDVDSHLMEPFDWLAARFPELAAELPPPDVMGEMFRRSQDDMMDALPGTLRRDARNEAEAEAATVPEVDDIRLQAPVFVLLDQIRTMTREQALDMVSGLHGTEQVIGQKIVDVLFARGAWEGSERVEILDEIGIDFQFSLMNGGHQPYVEFMKLGKGARAYDALAAGNTWSAEAIAGYTDRLSFATLVDLADVDWSITEITRTRELGSRMVQVKTDPVDGVSIAHPDFDRFWSAVTDLGMVVMIHIGAARPLLDPGWDNNGGDIHHTSLLHFSQNHQVAQVALAALIFGGVFERHERLRVVVSELGHEWLPSWLHMVDRLARPNRAIADFLGTYRYPLLPSEYVARAVHVSTLSSNSGTIRDAVLGSPPGSVVFSSDYPHTEGGGIDIMPVFHDALAGVDDTILARYYGAALADDLALLS